MTDPADAITQDDECRDTAQIMMTGVLGADQSDVQTLTVFMPVSASERVL
jgi:hypothetical protein